MDTETRTLETPDVDLVYEVRRPASEADGRPAPARIGHPMDARGFDSWRTLLRGPHGHHLRPPAASGAASARTVARSAVLHSADLAP